MPAVAKSRHVIAFAIIAGMLMYFIVFPIKICIVYLIKLSLERPVDIPISLSCTKLFFFSTKLMRRRSSSQGGRYTLLRYDPLVSLFGGALRVPE